MQNVALDALLAGIASSCHVKVNPHVLEFDGDVPCMTSPISQIELTLGRLVTFLVHLALFTLKTGAKWYFIFVPMV